MLRNLILPLFCFIFFMGVAQKNNPTPEDISIAKELKNSYEDEDVVFQSRKTVVEFKRNKKEGLVEVNKSETSKVIGISASSRMQHAVFYDSESEVGLFELKDRRGKKIYSNVIDESMKSDDIFHNDYRVKFTNISFPLQGYQKSIKTEKNYRDIKYFTSEYFNHSFRIIDGTLTVYIPTWLNLELREFNFEGNDISKTVIDTENGKKVVFEYKNLAPRSDDQGMPGPSYVYPHILFLAKSYKEGNSDISLFNDVGDLYNWYNSLIESVDVDPSVFKSKVDELVEGVTSEEEKIKRIYYWVQDNIRYIAFEDGIAGFKPDSPQNVFTKLYGDCKGMAFLTKSMLVEAGFDSRLVWIGTDRLAYNYETPSLSVDNHMICSVVLDGETIFLDGTEKYNRYGDYASRIQNKQALMEDKDGYKLLTVPMVNSEPNVDHTRYDLQVEGDKLVGKVNRKYSGECRVFFQNSYSSFGSGDREEVLFDYLVSGNNNCTVKEVTPFDSEMRDENLQLDYELSIGNSISEFDGTLYLDLDPVKDAVDFIFENDREMDFKFSIQKRKITEIALEIPEGYKVGALPKNLFVDNEMVAIQVNYDVVGNKINYKKDVHLKKRLVRKDQFGIWNDAFKELKENLSEQVTLIKQ